MSTITYCDACGEEGASNKFGVPIHHMAEGKRKGEYVDSDLEPVSGRSIVLDLCNKCNNAVYREAMKEIRLRRKDKGMDETI